MTDEITVLHIDDEAAYMDLQEMYLEKIVGADISTVRTTAPADVLALVAEHDVDCVVCDYDMPDVDGLDVLATVREAHPVLPFVLLTGKGNEDVASEAFRHGATDYVQKPSGSEQYRTLGERIRNAVARYRHRRDDRAELERCRRHLDRIADPVFALDRDRRLTHCNDAAADLLGGPAASLLGTPIADHLPADADLDDELRRCLADGTPVDVRASFDDGAAERAVRIYPGPDGLSVLVLGPDPGGSSR